MKQGDNHLGSRHEEVRSSVWGSRRIIVITVVTVLLLSAGVFVAVLRVDHAPSPAAVVGPPVGVRPMAVVPDLTTLSPEAAYRDAQRAGLTVWLFVGGHPLPNPVSTPLVIRRQSPAAGAKLLSGSAVSIYAVAAQRASAG